MDNAQINWPDRPTCHGVTSPRLGIDVTWQEPRGDDGGPYHYTFRTCSYCGSMHPEDLANAMSAGARLSMADWKYGWPHKVYIEMPNPKAGQESRIGSRSTDVPGQREPIMGAAPKNVTAKFYSEHIQDLSDEALALLSGLIGAQTGVTFERDENGVRWRYTPAAPVDAAPAMAEDDGA